MYPHLPRLIPTAAAAAAALQPPPLAAVPAAHGWARVPAIRLLLLLLLLVQLLLWLLWLLWLWLLLRSRMARLPVPRIQHGLLSWQACEVWVALLEAPEGQALRLTALLDLSSQLLEDHWKRLALLGLLLGVLLLLLLLQLRLGVGL